MTQQEEANEEEEDEDDLDKMLTSKYIPTASMQPESSDALPGSSNANKSISSTLTETPKMTASEFDSFLSDMDRRLASLTAASNISSTPTKSGPPQQEPYWASPAPAPLQPEIARKDTVNSSYATPSGASVIVSPLPSRASPPSDHDSPPESHGHQSVRANTPSRLPIYPDPAAVNRSGDYYSDTVYAGGGEYYRDASANLYTRTSANEWTYPSTPPHTTSSNRDGVLKSGGKRRASALRSASASPMNRAKKGVRFSEYVDQLLISPREK
jgi:hypothetical protein